MFSFFFKLYRIDRMDSLSNQYVMRNKEWQYNIADGVLQEADIICYYFSAINLYFFIFKLIQYQHLPCITIFVFSPLVPAVSYVYADFGGFLQSTRHTLFYTTSKLFTHSSLQTETYKCIFTDIGFEGSECSCGSGVCFFRQK